MIRGRPRRLALGALLVSLSAVVGSLVTFVGEPPLDLAVVRGARGGRDGSLGAVMELASEVGYASWLVPISVVLALVVAFVLRRPRAALLVALATATASGATRLLKETFDRARPEGAHELVAGFSMPSGHASSSAAFALSIAIAVVGLRWATAVRLAAGAFALAVGVSRVVLGVHYPSDVFAGWCLGCGVALLVTAAVKAIDDPAVGPPAR